MMPRRLPALPVLSLVTPTSSGPRGPSPKTAARRDALARREAMSAAARTAASARIAEATAIAIVARVPSGATIALYAAKGSEVDTAPLEWILRGRGYEVAYPRVVAGARLLALHHTTLDHLAPAAGRLGLREPELAAPEIAPAEIAAFCIPGLAFDRAGGRLGWGLGHYDATLAAAPDALRIGLAFETQLIDAVPREPHDIALHLVVTEAGAHEVGA